MAKSAAVIRQDQREYAKRRRLDPAFREQCRLRMKAWRAANVEHVRAKNIERYGITLEEYKALYACQEGKCAICATPIADFDGGRQPLRAHIDHDHATGQVRGLLCMLCNTMLGCAKDSVSTLNSAIKYLGG